MDDASPTSSAPIKCRVLSRAPPPGSPDAVPSPYATSPATQPSGRGTDSSLSLDSLYRVADEKKARAQAASARTGVALELCEVTLDTDSGLDFEDTSTGATKETDVAEAPTRRQSTGRTLMTMPQATGEAEQETDVTEIKPAKSKGWKYFHFYGGFATCSPTRFL